MLVTVWICDRCNLRFLADEPPDICPSCRRYHSHKTIIRLVGRDVPVGSVRVYGDNPLKKAAVKLANLRLGIRCPHGFIADYICGLCNPT
jgi:hypothetical protein